MPRFALIPLLVLPMIACQPAGDTDVSARFDAIDERLTSIETKLDEAAAKVDQMSTWASEQRAEDERKRKEREELKSERDARRAELEARRAERREQRRSLRESGESTLGTPETDDTSELMAEGIRCEPMRDDQQPCSIDRALLDELLANPARLSKQARVVPRMRDGESDGFKLYGIRPGSLPKQLGLKNGDTVRMVNGRALLSIDDAMDAYMKLRKSKKLEFEIERKGKVFDLVIDIVE
ncbi:MAG: hypothetical protein AAF799_36040 [Myxococcota bacterium]